MRLIFIANIDEKAIFLAYTCSPQTLIGLTRVSRPTLALIDLAALTQNLSDLIAVNRNSKIVSVVKANAYGNGAVPVARAIQQQSDILAVAFIDEALALVDSGITKPILVLQGPHTEDDFARGAHADIIWMMHSQWQLDAYHAYVHTQSTYPKAWFKFDTGMHRLGLPCDRFSEILSANQALINEHTVIVSHLACADEPEQDHANHQISRFLQLAKQSGLPLCIANSAAAMRFEQARQDYVRIGIAMYGATPFQVFDNPMQLRPVMQLNSEIIALRTIPAGDTVGYGATWQATQQTVIATVALGYADGYPRHAPIGTPAWCNNQRIHLVGRVSMDMLTFDVSHLAEPKIGDMVQLWGDKLPINEVAEHVGTIGYELMTRVSARVPRAYT